MAVTDPEGQAYYDINRRRINDTFNIQNDQNAYQQQVSNLNYAQKLAALQTRFNQGYDKFPGTFANRGLLDSGIYQHALSNLYSNQAMAVGQNQAQQNLANQGFNMNWQQLVNTRQNALGDIDQQEAARREAIASSLQAAQ